MAQKAGHLTGIDPNEGLISYASKRKRKGIQNVHFEVHDASDLSAYCDRKFDFAVTSMAIHQFDPQLAIKILPQMKRIAYGTESMAGGDLYHNFLKYMSAGGLGHFTDAAGLYIKSKSIKGNGVFVVAGYE